MLRLKEATGFRKRMAGIGLIAGPLAFGVSDVLRLTITGGKEGAPKLAAIAEASGTWQFISILDMLGIILLVPAVLGLMHLLRERRPRHGNVAGGLAIVGVLGWAAHNAGYLSFLGAAATSELARGEIDDFIAHWEETASAGVWVAMFLIGFFVGMVLLAVGVHRSKVAPQSASSLFLAGIVAWFVISFTPASESFVALAAVHAVIVAGLGSIGRMVLNMSDTQWEAATEIAVSPPVTTPEQAPGR